MALTTKVALSCDHGIKRSFYWSGNHAFPAAAMPPQDSTGSAGSREITAILRARPDRGNRFYLDMPS